MSTIAIITVAAGGNVPPAIMIGRELVARGHRVHMLGQESQRTRLAAAGFDFIALRSLEFWGDRRNEEPAPATADDVVRLASSRDIRNEAGDILTRLAPDAVLVDVLMATAILGAHDAGLATAVLFHTYYEFWLDGYHGRIGPLARLRGVDVRRTWESADAQLVTCEADFDPAARTRNLAHRPTWVGAIVAGTASAPAQGPPLVLVSLSSTWVAGQTDAYQRIITALGTLPVRGLVTLGGVTPDRELTVPANVEVRDYARHDEVMPGVSLVVGHGGHATTFTALAHGKPLLILPMHPMLDQGMVGASMVEAGAGLMLERTASSEQIATAIRSVLADPRIAKSTQAIGARLRASDAAGAAATCLLELPSPKGRSINRPPVRRGAVRRAVLSSGNAGARRPLLTQLDEGDADGTPRVG